MPAFCASALMADGVMSDRPDDVLVLEAAVDRVPAVDAHRDRDDAESDQDGRCDEPSDLEKLAHVPTPFRTMVRFGAVSALSPLVQSGTAAELGLGLPSAFVREIPDAAIAAWPSTIGPWSRHKALKQQLPVPFETATVGDAMSRGVISCPAETPLRVVARMMATFSVHAIFVFDHVDEDDEAPRLWALVSDLDLVAATPLDLDMVTAGTTAVTPLVSVAADSPIAEAGGLMATYGVAHLAVTEGVSRRPIGVISTLDIARAVAAGHGPRETFAEVTPAAIRSEQRAGFGCDHELLARRHDLDAEIAEEADALGGLLADVFGVFADLAGEREHVQQDAPRRTKIAPARSPTDTQDLRLIEAARDAGVDLKSGGPRAVRVRVPPPAGLGAN